MKILIITPYAEPEKGACVVRVNAFAQYFKGRGHEVVVAAPVRKNIAQEPGVQRYSGIAELCGTIASGKFDAIIGTSPPITHNFFALLAAKISGSKFFLDAKDPFTEVMRKMEPERAGSVKFLAFEFMEAFAHKFSDKIIFLNKPYLENAVKKFSLPRERVFLGPNGSDTQKIFFSAEERKKMRKERGFGKEFVLVYAGGMGDKDLQGFLSQSLPEISKKHNARALFILSYEGSSAQGQILSKLKWIIKEKALARKVSFEFNVPFAKLYKYLSAADAGLVAYPDFEMQVLGAKVFDYIAAGLPVCAKASEGNTELRTFIERNGVGFMAVDWKGFNREFSALLKNAGKYPRKKIIGVALKNSREKTCEKVLSEIEKAVNG